MPDDHDWYVLVKIKAPTEVHYRATDLNKIAAVVANSVQSLAVLESAYVVMDNGFGDLIRPHWAKDYEVNKE